MKIYLIDEQSHRQQNFGWTMEKFEKFKNIISVYRESEALSFERVIQFNIVLLHESFPNKELKRQIYNHNDQNRNFGLIVFSGSKKERKKNEIGNRVDLPVSIFYQNLEIFLEKIRNGEKPNANYLIYGEKPNADKAILEEIIKRNNDEKQNTIGSNKENLIFITNNEDIEIPFNEIDERTLYNDNTSDEEIHNIIIEELNKKEYDNIYIPLCFGSILSDFNGLRLATHIRCTSTKNQLKNIFIYGVVSYEEMINHECFDILKTKNVFYIDYDKKVLQDAENKETLYLLEEELSNELSKVKLIAPKDNHSITNELTIYRWATYMKYDSVKEKTNKNIISNLYFKHYNIVNAIEPISEDKNVGYFINGKANILVIDDELDNGWEEFYKKFMEHSPNIKLKFLNPKNENIDNIEKFLEEFNPDIVLLDLRLQREDANNNKTDELSGYKLLHKIKEYNRGIQVIIITASNKVWNYKKLMNSGANGYIIKRPKSSDIKNDISELKNSIEKSCEKIYKKKVYYLIKQIEENGFSLLEDKSFKKKISVASKLIEQDELDYAYFTLYLILESFANESFGKNDDYFKCFDQEYSVKEGDEWLLKYNEDIKNGSYFSNEKEESEKLRTTLFKVSCILKFLLGKSNPELKEFGKLNKLRNDIAHDKHHSTNKEFICKVLKLIQELQEKAN